MSGQTELRDGDIYRWSWIEPPKHEPYWCKTRIAIAHDGKLFDTFSMHHGSKFIQGGWGPRFQHDHVVRSDRVEIELIANIYDMDEILHGEERYYDPSDVVDLRHSNNGMAPIYIKNGSTRSAEKIAERIRSKIEEAEHTRQHAENTIKRLTETLGQVEAGENLESIWF